MNTDLYDASKVASYFIWDITRHACALDHWYCAEDIACYFEVLGIRNLDDALSFLKKDKDDVEYVDFLRNISYRIFLYTRNDDSLFNWYAAEKLTHTTEWLIAVSKIAEIFHRLRFVNNADGEIGIQSELIRRFYRRF